MRLAIPLAALVLAGCAAPGGPGGFPNLATQPTPTPPRALAVCTPRAVLDEGRNTRQYPSNCPATPALVDRYSLGREIARVEEEMREVDGLLASSDGPGFIGRSSRIAAGGLGSSALFARRLELNRVLQALKAEAART